MAVAMLPDMRFVGRLTPVCFGFVFSLSGAIGPILGQNFGAGQWGRIQRTLSDSLIVMAVFCMGVSLLLWLSQNFVINSFKLNQQAAEIVALFCTYLAITFVFNGCYLRQMRPLIISIHRD